MSRVEVAGVEVSTEHFIGGERVASDSTFDGPDPDRRAAARRGRAGRRARGRPRASPRRPTAFPAWAALGPAGRAEHDPPARRPGRRERRAARGGRVRRHGDARSARCVRGSSRAARATSARTPTSPSRYEERVWESNGTRNRVVRMPSGPAVVITPVERAVHALDLEDGAGARRRLHRRAQAGRVVAALLLAALPTSWRRPASRRASSTSCRGSARRSVRRSSRHPGVRRISLHRLARDRPCTSARRRPATSSRSPASSAARGRSLVFADADLEAAAAEGGGPVRRRRPGLPRRDAAPRRGVRRRAVPRAASTGSPTSTCSATRATTRRRSRR